MEVGGDFAVLQRQDDLDQAGNARGCFQMADIGFDGAKEQWVLHRPPLRQDLAQRRTSIGSPRAVPVPWVSTKSMSAGRSPALASALRSNSSWAGPLGTVRPLLRPSWFTADPRIKARTRSPSACASESRLRTRSASLARTYPSAAASNVLQWPSAAIIWALQRLMCGFGVSIKLTPPASARRALPSCRLSQARSTATNDEEQAVSTARQGPASQGSGRVGRLRC